MDPVVFRLNVLLGELAARQGDLKVAAANEFMQLLIANPSHRAAYLHFALDLAKAEVAVRKLLTLFIQSLANEGQVAAIVSTIMQLAQDEDPEVVSGALNAATSCLKPAFMAVLHMPSEENNRVWGELAGILYAQMPNLLVAGGVFEAALPSLLVLAEQIVYVYTPSHTPPQSALGMLGPGFDPTLVNAVTADMLPLLGHPILNKDEMMSTATRIVEGVIGAACKPASSLPVPLAVQHADGCVHWLARIGMLRPGFSPTLVHGLLALAKDAPRHLAGVTDKDEVVLEPSLQLSVRNALGMIRNNGICPPHLTLEIDHASMSGKLTTIAVKPAPPLAPPQLDLSACTSMSIEDVMTLVLTNLAVFNPASEADPALAAQLAAAGPALLERVLEAVMQAEAADMAGGGASDVAVAGGADQQLAIGEGAVAIPAEVQKPNPLAVPAVAAWLTPASGQLQWSQEPAATAQAALQRLLTDSCLPQWAVSSSTGASGSTAGGRAASLSTIFGAGWSRSLDHLSSLLRAPNSVAVGAEGNGVSDRDGGTGLPLAAQLAEELSAYVSGTADASAPSAAVPDLQHLRRLASVLLLAGCRVYRSCSDDTTAYTSFLLSSLRSLIALCQRLDTRDVTDVMLSFVVDLPFVPGEVVAELAKLCVRPPESSKSTKTGDWMERAAMACLVYLLLLRPGLRPLIVDILLSLSIASDSGDVARKSSLGNVSKRLIPMTGGVRDHVVEYARRALLSCAEGAARVAASVAADQQSMDGGGAKRARDEKDEALAVAAPSEPRLVIGGGSAGFGMCGQVDELLAGVSQGTSPLSKDVLQRVIRLWMAVCSAEPSYLHEIVSAAGASGPSSLFSIVAGDEMRQAVKAVQRASGRSHGIVLLAFAGAAADASSPVPVPVAQSTLVQIGVESICDGLLEDIESGSKRQEEAGGAEAATGAGAAAGGGTGLREDPAVLDLLRCARLLHTEGASADGTADSDGQGVPLFMIPLAALLQPADLTVLLRAAINHGSAPTVRYAVQRALHTPRALPAAVQPDELMCTLVVEADGINDRSISAPDKVRLLTEVSNCVFDDRATYTDRVLISGVRRIIEAAIRRHSDTPDRHPVSPVLLMRCLLVTAQTRPELRSAVVELVLMFIRRAGGSMFESKQMLAEWPPAAGTPSTCHVWEGFVIFVKATVPLSLPLLAELPIDLVSILLKAKTQQPLSQRFRTWYATWAGKDAAPNAKQLGELVASLATAAAPAGAAAPAAAAAPAGPGAKPAVAASAPASAAASAAVPASAAGTKRPR